MSFYNKIINQNKEPNLNIEDTVSSVLLNSPLISELIKKVNFDLIVIYKEIKSKLQYKSKIDANI